MKNETYLAKLGHPAAEGLPAAGAAAPRNSVLLPSPISALPITIDASTERLARNTHPPEPGGWGTLRMESLVWRIL